MFHPELVLGHHVSPAELATLPVYSKPLLTVTLSYVLVDFTEFKRQAALLAPLELVVPLAFIEQVVCHLPDKDQPPTLLTHQQHPTILDIVLPFILPLFKWFTAVVTHTLHPQLALPLASPLSPLHGVFNNRGLSTIGEVYPIQVLPTAFVGQLRPLHRVVF